MYLNVFLNTTNMFSHQKIVYWDLGTANFFLNTTSTTEKCLNVSSVSEWMSVLMYQQPCNVECCLVSLVARFVSALHLMKALHTWRGFESHVELIVFMKGCRRITKYIYVYYKFIYARRNKNSGIKAVEYMIFHLDGK